MFELDDPTVELIQLAVLLRGVAWGVYRFGAEAPHKPRVEFNVDANFIGPIGNHHATEFTVTNLIKGLRTKAFDQTSLSVRGIEATEKLEEWKGREPRLLLPHKLIDKEGMVYRNKYNSIFVKPSVSQDIKYFS